MLIVISSLIYPFNHSTTTDIYTLSLHDALPISCTIFPSATRSSREAFSPANSRRYHHRAACARAARGSRMASARSVKTHEAKLPLVAVVGPTASGKSSLAVWLAGQLGGGVIACESTQLYRGRGI